MRALRLLVSLALVALAAGGCSSSPAAGGLDATAPEDTGSRVRDAGRDAGRDAASPAPGDGDAAAVGDASEDGGARLDSGPTADGGSAAASHPPFPRLVDGRGGVLAAP